MTFKEAVEQTPQVAKAYKAGILAFGDYSSKVIVPDKRLLGGSVDIDAATVELVNIRMLPRTAPAKSIIR